MTNTQPKHKGISMQTRVNATRDLITTELYPWNEHRIEYYAHALLLVAVIYDANLSTNSHASKLLDRINNRLESPLTTEAELQEAYNFAELGLKHMRACR